MEPGVVVAGMDLDCGSGGGGPGEGVGGTRGGFLAKNDECSQTNNLPADLQTVDCRIRTRLPRSQGEPRSSLNGSQTLIDNSQLSLHKRVCNAPAVSWERANRCPTPTGNGRQCHI